MEHINFIETKSKALIEHKRLELDYFVMILIAVGVCAIVLALHMIQSSRLSGYQHELALIRQSMQSPPEETQATPVTGVAWSEWLKKYSAEFPKTIRLHRVAGTIQGGQKIVLEVIGQRASDVSRAKKNLIQSDLCHQVELGKITPSEEGVWFELECT